jgi:hypothetical protein
MNCRFPWLIEVGVHDDENTPEAAKSGSLWRADSPASGQRTRKNRDAEERSDWPKRLARFAIDTRDQNAQNHELMSRCDDK